MIGGMTDARRVRPALGVEPERPIAKINELAGSVSGALSVKSQHPADKGRLRPMGD
jgi:hypothetical protein